MSSLRVFESIQDWRKLRASDDFGSSSLGFVPTMGALHEGHASLVRRSAAENDRTLVSIFVNPTQFNDPKDLEKYPRTLERDLELLAKAGATDVLLPRYEELYADRYLYRVQETEFSRLLCGAHRPGHFDGVLTVVLKLLGIAQARRAYFGEKDYQQLRLIDGMVRSFFLPVEIVPCPTLREPDGLAMSSRNLNLTPAERELAPRFARGLRQARSAEEARAQLESHGFQVDYVEDRGNRRFGAVRLGSVRLIDNISLSEGALS